MKKIKQSEYTILNGRKFFYEEKSKNFQCAYCLWLQGNRTFVRNKEGLIIGIELKPENEEHADECKNKYKKE